jgi:hypothetical protein
MADRHPQNPVLPTAVGTSRAVQPTEGDIYGDAYLARARGRGGATFGRAVQAIAGDVVSQQSEAALWNKVFLAIRGDDA